MSRTESETREAELKARVDSLEAQLDALPTAATQQLGGGEAEQEVVERQAAARVEGEHSAQAAQASASEQTQTDTSEELDNLRVRARELEDTLVFTSNSHYVTEILFYF